ncbi:MAG: PilW family protein [Bacteroidota bacterium]
MKFKCIRFCFLEKNSGFTLIELLVAVAISSIVLLVIGQFFISTNKTHTIQAKVSDTQQSIRAVMELMERDIRMAGLNPTGDAEDAGFEKTDQDEIRIRYDYNGGGSYDVDVSYYLEDGILKRKNHIGSKRTLSLSEKDTIDSLNFEYITDGGSVNAVKITIDGKISGAYADDLVNKLSFTSTVKPRNM